ncbi:MAG: hypothetical protein IKM73_00755 [Acidaminococcaceae bacterium]|nr:hypothetical protein [Acidaminococcaceae bacterium]MBR6859836.1 hypothetical protein [Acidaminococcaceae bacterium]
MSDGKITCNQKSVLRVVKILEDQVNRDRKRYSKHYKDGYLKALSEVERIVRSNMEDAVA